MLHVGKPRHSVRGLGSCHLRHPTFAAAAQLKGKGKGKGNVKNDFELQMRILQALWGFQALEKPLVEGLTCQRSATL